MDGISRFLDLVIVVIKHLSQEFLPLVSPPRTLADHYINRIHQAVQLMIYIYLRQYVVSLAR